MLRHTRSRLALVTLATLALAITAGPAGAADPAGNNGTVKVDTKNVDTLPDNQPHAACTFWIDFYGFDAGADARVIFTLIAPTVDTEISFSYPAFDLDFDRRGRGRQRGRLRHPEAVRPERRALPLHGEQPGRTRQDDGARGGSGQRRHQVQDLLGHRLHVSERSGADPAAAERQPSRACPRCPFAPGLPGPKGRLPHASASTGPGTGGDGVWQQEGPRSGQPRGPRHVNASALTYPKTPPPSPEPSGRSQPLS